MAFIKNYVNSFNELTINNPIDKNKLLKLILYVYSKNSYATLLSINNLNSYMEKINTKEAYKDDFDGYQKFKFLKKSVEFKIDKDFKDLFNRDNTDEVYTILTEQVSEDYLTIEEIKLNLALIRSSTDYTDSEAKYYNDWINYKYRYSVVFTKINDLEPLIERIKLDNEKSGTDLIEKIDKEFSTIYRELCRANSVNKYDKTDFSTFNEESMNNAISSMYKKYTNENNKLVTGYQALNALLGGGFEGARVYTFLAPTKGFKSGLLLNIMMSICLNNMPNRTDKHQTVVYFTMENDYNETLQRMYCWLTGSNDIAGTTQENIKQIFNDFLDDCKIGFKVIFRGNKTVTTAYLRTICEKMEIENNEECICMIQDYIKRIRPENPTSKGDIRLDLGDVINEFSVFAKEYNIPVITASQLNRDAYRTVELMQSSCKYDICKNLNASQVGESTLILENCDYAIAIYRETIDKTLPEFMDREEDTYLSFKLLNSRSFVPDGVWQYFVQPFENGMKLKEDLYSEQPAARHYISDNGNEQSTLNFNTTYNKNRTIDMKNKKKIKAAKFGESEDNYEFED